jgi:PHD/YefM family antitoxin component YafN of YafNO toxin-antitoxin module
LTSLAVLSKITNMSITATTATSYSNIQTNVLSFISKVNEYDEAVIITTPSNQNAVLISEEEWNNTIASLEILSNNDLMNRIKSAENEIKNNKIFKNINEVEHYVLD